MADSKLKRGKQDRAKVAKSQAYEVQYLAKKYGVSPRTVRRAIKKTGNGRRKVEALLRARRKRKA